MKKTNNIYNLRNIWTRTTAAEAAAAANEDAIRAAVIEIEMKHDDAAIIAEFTRDGNYIDFDYIITDEATATDEAEQLIETGRSARDRIKVYIFRHSDADAEGTAEDFAEDHAAHVVTMLDYYMSEREHIIIL